MSHCSSLGEASAVAMEAENVEIIVLAELEHVF
jgi:hypothetical protein